MLLYGMDHDRADAVYRELPGHPVTGPHRVSAGSLWVSGWSGAPAIASMAA